MHLLFLFSVASLLSLNILATAPNESSITPYMPIVVPLAARGPYLGAYLAGGQDKNLASMDPQFWSRSPLGWRGLVRVDSEVFNWMGNLTGWPAAENASLIHTASSSSFTFATPLVSLTASFLSPITPSDLLRQSIPFSYLSITAASLDDKPHQVEVYTDINGLWAADGEHEELEWGKEGGGQGEGWKGARFRLKDQRMYQEQDDRILHGDVYYAARDSASSSVFTTYSIGHDANITRQLFANTGSVGDAFNSTFRQTRVRSSSDSETVLDEPVFALSQEFGIITASTPLASRSALIAVGHIRNSIVQYMTTNSTSQESIIALQALWTSRFASATEMLAWFLQDFETVRKMSQTWEEQLEQDAVRVHGQEYADIVSISTRQIFMALEAVCDPLPANTTDLLTNEGTSAMVMLKEISSNGNCQTTDVIAPFLPFLVYAEPRLLGWLVEPILRYVQTGFYKPLPTPHDLGDHYPNATGRNDFIYANLPVEENGNMLAMLYAGMRLGAGLEQVRRYWMLMEQWAGWLENETLYPEEQRSTDDFFGPEANQTNLAIKGIIGLGAMAEMSDMLGFKDQYNHYKNVSTTLASEFLKVGISDDGTHILGAYDHQDSWVTTYNLYLDKLLSTNLFPQNVTDMQDKFYLAHAQPYGPALDSRRPLRTKTDWLLWTAGASTLAATRDMFVNAVASYFRQSQNNVFGDHITTDEGWSVGFLTRPVVGGHFSLLALDTMARKGRTGSVLRDIRKKLEAHPTSLGVLAFLVGCSAIWFVIRRMRSRRLRRAEGGFAGREPAAGLSDGGGTYERVSLSMRVESERPSEEVGSQELKRMGKSEDEFEMYGGDQMEKDAKPLLADEARW